MARMKRRRPGKTAARKIARKRVSARSRSPTASGKRARGPAVKAAARRVLARAGRTAKALARAGAERAARTGRKVVARGARSAAKGVKQVAQEAGRVAASALESIADRVEPEGVKPESS
jgi:hypothetical protein